MRSPVLVLAAMLASCSTGECGPPPDGQRLPNIVVFSIDTLRADHLGLAGHAGGISPRIDAFARESVVFERAVSQAPSTTPSHMSLFTGLTPAVHRVVNVDSGNPVVRPLEPYVPTFTESLQSEGYYTVGLHGGGNVDGQFGFDRGFHLYSEDFVSFNWVKAYRTPQDLDVVRHWLSLAEERGRPLFLFLHHYVCHVPYVSAPEELRERYLAGKKVPGLSTGPTDESLARIADGLGRVPSTRLRIKEAAMALPSRIRSFWAGVDLARTDHREHVMALYDASVAYSDLLFGRVMDILKEQGAYRDSIIVLLSDHGEEFFEHGGREHGRLFTEHLHVPLVIRFPDAPGIAPRRVKDAVRLFDVMPTVMEYLKIPVAGPVQAQSFLPLAEGRGGYSPVIVSYNGQDLRSIRVEKGGVSWADEGWKGSPTTLFDLRVDPGETANLASTRADLEAGMARIAGAQREEDAAFLGRVRSVAPAPGEPDRRVLEQLEALGYLDAGGAR